VTVGVVVLLPALAKVPRGVVWSTSEKEVAPPPKTAAALIVTVTAAVPLAGAMSLQISIRVCVAWPFCAPTNVSACAPKVIPETVVPELIETPTRRRRFAPMPTVWFHPSVVEATDVKALVAGSVEIVGAKPRRTSPGGAPGRAGLRTTLPRSGLCPRRMAGVAQRRRMTPHPAERRADAFHERPMADFKSF
jgi:hypothetical protein